MQLLSQSIIVAVLVFLLCNLLEDLIFGNRGRKNYITNHFRFLKGFYAKDNKKNTNFAYENGRKKLTARQFLIYTLPLCSLGFFLSFMVFKSIPMAVVLSLFGLAYPRINSNNAEKRTKMLLNMQLRDAMNSIASSLKAGLSLNTAIIKCVDDLERLYESAKEKPILTEFMRIKSDLYMGISVDDALKDFGTRMKLEDVEDFVNSVIIVRQKGGNLIEVMNDVKLMITDKISIKREIEVLTAGKKLEAKIISLIPIIFVILLSLFSPYYLEPLYSSLAGKILIIFGFLLILINFLVGRKIVDIEV